MLDNTSSDPRQWWSECGRRVEVGGGRGGCRCAAVFLTDVFVHVDLYFRSGLCTSRAAGPSCNCGL